MDESAKLTADVVVLSERDGVDHVLLIEREWPPFEGQLALPGGHVDLSEEIEDTATRELVEETGLSVPVSAMRFVFAYGAVGRDPRGRYVTFAYVTRVDGTPALAAGDDASAAEWVPVMDALNGQPLAFDHRRILSDAVAFESR